MRVIQSWISKLGLWPRVALATSLGFIVLFLALALLVDRVLKDDVNHVREQRLVIAKITASQVDSFLDQAIFSLEQFVRRATPASGSLELSDLVRVMEDESELEIFPTGLVLLDADGRSIASRPPGLYPAGSDLSGLSHVAQALELEQVSISDPFQDPFSGQQAFALTVPVHDNGQVVGAVCGFINLTGDRMTAPLQEATAISESEHAVIVDRQGRVVVSTFFLPLLSPGEHSSFYRRAMAIGEPVVETVPFELDLPGEPFGHLHVMAMVPLANAPWGLVVGGDEADLFAGIERLRLALIVIGITALIAVWALTLVGARRLVRPIQHLTKAADQIADGNLDVSLQTSDGGEIGVMAMALDRMRNQLLTDLNELAEWNKTLEEQVAEQTEDLRRQQARTQQLLRELIDAQESERTRLARELHDEIGQALTAVELSLGHLANAISPEDEKAFLRLEQSRALTEQTATDLRAIIAALRPGTLDQLGLVPALEWIGDHLLGQADISVSITARGIDGRLPSEIETTLFRIAQEAMSNVGRHSQATSLTINLFVEPEEVTMTLRDDGRGFISDLAQTPQAGSQNLGIAGMRERASLAGGQFLIESIPNEGTEVQVILPIAPQTEEEGVLMTNEIIKLIVVDDHAIMREGLIRLLEEEPDLQIVGMASDGREAIDLALQEPADIILLDIVMEDMTGLDAAREISSRQPDIKIIMLTMYEEEAFLREALQVGASGYFLKGSNSTELIKTIRLVHQGGTYLAPKMAGEVEAEFTKSQE